jgi:hypothetical protein
MTWSACNLPWNRLITRQWNTCYRTRQNDERSWIRDVWETPKLHVVGQAVPILQRNLLLYLGAFLTVAQFVEFEVLTAVVTNVDISLEIAPRSPHVNQSFETSVHMWTTRRYIPEAGNISSQMVYPQFSDFLPRLFEVRKYFQVLNSIANDPHNLRSGRMCSRRKQQAGPGQQGTATSYVSAQTPLLSLPDNSRYSSDANNTKQS